MASNVPIPVVLILTAALGATATRQLQLPYFSNGTLLSAFALILATESTVYFIYAIIIYPFFLSPLRHLPHPKGGLPLIGHAHTVFARPRGEIFRRWMKDLPNPGLIHYYGLWNSDRLVVTNHQALSELLVTKSYDFEKPAPLRKFLRDVLGNGLIIVEGDDHVFLRKNIMPSFTFRHIKELYPIFWGKAVEMNRCIASQVSKRPTESVEVNHWANQVTMDIIGLAAMGRDFECLQDGGRHPLVTNYEQLLEPGTEKQIYFAARIFGPGELVKKLPWGLNNQMNSIISTITSLCLQLVHDKKDTLKGAVKTDKRTANRDLLTLLIQSGCFTDQQLVDQLLTFLAAGHETTSSAFTWSAYLLATHPEIQKALREEIRQCFASEEGNAPADLAAALEGLPLLNGVCNEATRLYPTVPITVRRAVRDTSLVGMKVAKGTEVLIVPWATNRNPDLWGPNADEFDPYRWIDTDAATGKQRPNNSGGATSNFAFITFLHGPRSCIGQGFAKAELRCLVASFVSSFDITMANPNEKVVPDGVITTKPENGMHLNLKYLGDSVLSAVQPS